MLYGHVLYSFPLCSKSIGHSVVLQRDEIVGIGATAKTTARETLKGTLQDGEPAHERGPTKQKGSTRTRIGQTHTHTYTTPQSETSVPDIQGECSVEGDSESLGPCTLESESPLTVQGAELWMHNFVLHPAPTFEGDAMLLVTEDIGKAWLTSVTLQGHPEESVAAVAATISHGSAFFRGP